MNMPMIVGYGTHPETPTLDCLPISVLRSISSHLPLDDAKNLALTCRRFATASTPRIWHTIVLQNDKDQDRVHSPDSQLLSPTHFNPQIAADEDEPLDKLDRILAARYDTFINVHLRRTRSGGTAGSPVSMIRRLEISIDRLTLEPPDWPAEAKVIGGACVHYRRDTRCPICVVDKECRIYAVLQATANDVQTLEFHVDDFECYPKPAPRYDYSLARLLIIAPIIFHSLDSLTVRSIELARAIIPLAPRLRSLRLTKYCTTPEDAVATDDTYPCPKLSSACLCCMLVVTHMQRYTKFEPLLDLGLRDLRVTLRSTHDRKDLIYRPVIDLLLSASPAIRNLVIEAGEEDTRARSREIPVADVRRKIPDAILHHETLGSLVWLGPGLALHLRGDGVLPRLHTLVFAHRIRSPARYRLEALPDISLPELQQLTLYSGMETYSTARPGDTYVLEPLSSIPISGVILDRIKRNPRLKQIEWAGPRSDPDDDPDDDDPDPIRLYPGPASGWERQCHDGAVIRTYSRENHTFTHVRMFTVSRLVSGGSESEMKRAKWKYVDSEFLHVVSVEHGAWMEVTDYDGQVVPLDVLARVYEGVEGGYKWLEGGRDLSLSEKAWSVLAEWQAAQVI